MGQFLLFILIFTESFIGSKRMQRSVGKVAHHRTKIPRKWGFKFTPSFCKGRTNQKVFLMDEKIGMHGLLFIMNICGKCWRRGECNAYKRCLFLNKHFLVRRNNLQVNHLPKGQEGEPDEVQQCKMRSKMPE